MNVPDLIGALAVIDKLRPRLVVCDTEIEGQGSWRDCSLRFAPSFQFSAWP